MTCLLTVIVLSVERFIAMWSANGKGNTTKFIAGVKAALENNDLAKAKELCAKKQGVVASVVASAIIKYEQVENDETLTKEKKVEAIQKQLEEATALEMPALQQNLPIIATLTTLGTLVGLLGTVMGMIKSFAALASGDGAADSQALSTGISEALVNTATGIATGAFAVISYNYYSNKIDTLTYAIDEIGFCIVNAFNKTH
jgi:biopolymer transport protein ExbB